MAVIVVPPFERRARAGARRGRRNGLRSRQRWPVRGFPLSVAAVLLKELGLDALADPDEPRAHCGLVASLGKLEQHSLGTLPDLRPERRVAAALLEECHARDGGAAAGDMALATRRAARSRLGPQALGTGAAAAVAAEGDAATEPQLFLHCDLLEHPGGRCRFWLLPLFLLLKRSHLQPGCLLPRPLHDLAQAAVQLAIPELLHPAGARRRPRCAGLAS
eukprot:scaffold28835_cov63-Phaeocystis_antarctica.AAC.1